MFTRNFIPVYLIFLMWAIFLFERTSGIDLGFLGINPRHPATLPGILCAPLIHGDWSHLLNNSLSFLILGVVFFSNYPKIAVLVFVLIYLLTGSLVWLTARSDVYHIGMSGVIYGLASFIFFSGFYRGNTAAIALSLFTALLYGSMAWGVLPNQPGISWESHLSGAATGLFLAYVFRNIYSGIEREADLEERGEPTKDFKAFLKDREQLNP